MELLRAVQVAISSAFVLAAALQLCTLWHGGKGGKALRSLRQTSTAGITLYAAKLGVGLALLAASFAAWAERPYDYATAGLAAASVIVLPLLHVEHFALPASSFLVTGWTFASLVALLYSDQPWVLFDRLAWQQHLTSQLTIVLRLLLLLLDNISKRSFLAKSREAPTPLRTAPPLSRLTMFWLFGLFGCAVKTPLTMGELAREPDMAANCLYERFERQWEEDGERHSLLWVLAKAFAPELLAPIPIGAVAAFIAAAEPYLLYKLTGYLSNGSTDPHEARIVAISFVITGLGFPMLLAVSQTYVANTSAVIRTVLSQIVLRKSLRCSIAAARETGSGSAVSLISVDIPRIMDSLCWSFTSTFSVVILCTIGFILLGLIAGAASSLLVIAICIAGTLTTPLFGRGFVIRQERWSKLTDERVKLSTQAVANLTATVRAEEYDRYLHWNRIEARLIVASNALPSVARFAQLLYLALTHATATSASALAVLGIIQTVSWPLTCAVQNAGRMAGALAALQHIEAFLRAEEQDVSSPGGLAAGDELELRHASFGWDKRLLKDVTWSPAVNSLTLVIGSVGSGKSTLLNALLGEVPLRYGSFHRPADLKTAFVAQTAWLKKSLSIRQNIIFAEKEDPAWYSKVVKAVALDIDFERFPMGDQQLAKGLSGGQCQRIALARALYASRSATLILLDDPFSAIDVATERQCWNSLFGSDGILSDKTVIMTTNNLERLSDADHIVLLDCGQIKEQGKAEQLLSSDKSAVKGLYEDHAARRKNHSATAASRDAIETKPLESIEDDIEAELRQTDTVARRPFWRLLLLASPWQVGCILLVTLLGSAIGPSGPVPGILAEQFVAAKLEDRIKWVLLFGASAALWAMAFFILWAEGPSCYSRATQRLEKTSFERVLGAEFPVVARFPSGVLAQRQSSDTFIIKGLMQSAFGNVLCRSGELFVSAALIGIVAPQALWAFAFTIIAAFVLQAAYTPVIVRARALNQAALSGIYTSFGETIDLDGLRTIRALDAQLLTIERNDYLVDRVQPTLLALGYFETLFELGITVFAAFVQIFVVLVLLYTPAGRKPYSTVVGLATVGFSGMMSHYISNVAVMRTHLNSVRRLVELIDLPQQRGEKVGDGAAVDASGTVVFDKVCLRYGIDAPLTLDNFTLSIKPGESIGICGRTGSGKSTLLQALALLYPIERGSITVSGLDITRMDPEQLRQALTVVPQEPFLLETTIRNNLDPAQHHDDAEIWSALDKATCGRIVRELEGGLDHVCTGQEGSLSRGELQCLALARAFLRQSKIVVLDEASASIDMASEQALQQAMAMQGVTKLIVAHRLRTILNCDRIVVMEQGRIVEEGPPKELLKRDGGALRKLAGDEADE